LLIIVLPINLRYAGVSGISSGSPFEYMKPPLSA